ncbi:hypothetical protein Bca4012_021720 [Brassica carinata]
MLHHTQGKKKTKGQTRRCLCTLVKDRDDPGLGIKVAMSLPSTCHVPANISQRPESSYGLTCLSNEARYCWESWS